MIRFGKQLFDGPNLCDQFHNGGFVSLAHLQELFRGRRLNYFFSTACSKMVVTDLRLQLQHIVYGPCKIYGALNEGIQSE
jgi:hypothetical protein